MKQVLTASDLKGLSSVERQKRIAAVAESMPLASNGELAEINSQITAFEQKYSLESSALRDQIAAGAREETWEICRWLTLLNIRDHLGALSTRSR